MSCLFKRAMTSRRGFICTEPFCYRAAPFLLNCLVIGDRAAAPNSNHESRLDFFSFLEIQIGEQNAILGVFYVGESYLWVHIIADWATQHVNWYCSDVHTSKGQIVRIKIGLVKSGLCLPLPWPLGTFHRPLVLQSYSGSRHKVAKGVTPSRAGSLSPWAP